MISLDLAAYLKNTFEIMLAIGLLVLIAAPSGLMLFRLILLIFNHNPRLSWQQFPVVVAIGLVVIPMTLNTLGILLPNIMHSAALIAIFVLLPIILRALYRFAARRLDPPEGIPTPPLTRLESAYLLGITLFISISVIAPLLLHNTPTDATARIWQATSIGDYPKHYGVVAILARADHLPPANPFLSTDPVLRYYYLFYLLPAAAVRLSASTISVANALIAAQLLVAAIFPFLMLELGRHLRLPTRSALAAATLAALIGGLDLIFMVTGKLENGDWPTHIDDWGMGIPHHRVINAISGMFLWTPQHVLGLIGFLIVLWLLVMRFQQPTSRRLPQKLILAVFISALIGISTYVWVGLLAGLALFIAIEMVITLRCRESPTLVFDLTLAVALSLILSLPFLILLTGRDAASFEVAISPTGRYLRHGALFTRLLGANQLAYALDFPAQLLIDFGLVFIVGMIGLWSLRHHWHTRPAYRLAVALLISSLLIVLAIRDAGARYNDYAMRVAPLAWIVLSLLGGTWWSQRSHSRLWRSPILRAISLVFLLIGLGSTLYEPAIRVRTAHRLSVDQHTVYEWLNTSLNPDDIYQFGLRARFDPFFSERQPAIIPAHGLAMLYASDPALYEQMSALIQAAYTETSAESSAALFRSAGVDYMVASSDATAPLAAESDPDLPTHFELVYQNATFRIYRTHK